MLHYSCIEHRGNIHLHYSAVTIDHPDMEAGDNATYLDVLNYFCEIMTEKEVEALRRGEELRRSSDHESANQVKNTVLVLPKIDK